MIIVKLTILAWVLFFVFRFFAQATLSNTEKMLLAFGKTPQKLRPIQYIVVILFLLAIIGTVASVVWILFFK